MSAYQQFIKENLHRYATKGIPRGNTMRMVAWDWHYWKMGPAEREYKLEDMFNRLSDSNDIIREFGRPTKPQIRRWAWLDKEAGYPFDISEEDREEAWKRGRII